MEEANNQQIVSLKRIARVQSGAIIAQDDLQQGDICVFGANGVIGYSKNSNTNGPAIIISRKAQFGKIFWSNNPCWASDATFFIDQANPNVHLRWLYYALQTLDLDIESATAFPYRAQFDTAQLHWPDVQTQIQMASYLDRAIEHWQHLIREKQDLLILCAERRRTLITRATTIGLHHEEQLQTTNVKGIGTISTDWPVVALKWLIHSITSGAVLKTLPTAVHPGEFGVIQPAAIKDGRFDETQNYVLQLTQEFPLAAAVQKNDIFITKSGTADNVGLLALAGADYPHLTFSHNLVRLRVDGSKLIANWLYWVLSGAVGRMQVGALVESRSAARINLSQSDILDWLIPLPPLQVQEELVAYLNLAVKKLDELAQTTQQSIHLLHERRSVLLRDVISGKLNLKEHRHDFT